jgi:DNA-binding response OmpR family regulator
MKTQILLIDQSSQRSAAICSLLQQNDLQILPANTISESLQHLVNTEFSLVIISASLNEEATGLIKRIRKYESRYTPIVLMNTELLEETLTAARQCGISACLDQRYYLSSASAFRRITTKLLQKANQASRACA